MLFNLSNESKILLTIIMMSDLLVGVKAPLLYDSKVRGKKVLLPNWSSSNFNLYLSYCAIAFLMYSSGFVLFRWHQVPLFFSYFYQAQKIETVLALNQEIDKMRSN